MMHVADVSKERTLRSEGTPRVAIVGIGCRLPGNVNSPADFERFLNEHGDAVGPIPKERWNLDVFYSADRDAPGRAYVKAGAFLAHDLSDFDPEPFGMSPREASALDPQQRLLLEVTWEALEDAGIPAENLRGSNTSVFVGGFMQDYQMLAFSPHNRWLIDMHTAVGASATVLSNRISYVFDLRGPSITLDTACSSSLVATHLGCQSILDGRSDVALIGGVNVMLSPMPTIAMCKGRFLAEDGRSKTFDASADGYGRGEGCGVVVLKRLDRAIADGDRIYAVLDATGVNQDGRTDGMPLPNESAQRQLCAEVLKASGLQPGDIGYVEAHGTGTRAGDPVEVRALGSVYGANRESPLPIGSVKTNIGHLEAAAGVAGLIKATLSVYRRRIFPVRTLNQLNPEIPLTELNLEVATEAKDWQGEGPVHAAVNSFGYGGTNAHVILSEWLPQASSEGESTTPARWQCPVGVPVSGASESALRRRADAIAAEVTASNFRDIAYTLAHRTPHLTDRAVVFADDAETLRAGLRALSSSEESDRFVAGRASGQRRLLWVFTGMGPQWWKMGQDLYREQAVYRDALDEADELFRQVAGWSILQEMLKDEPDSLMQSNHVAQPANFMLQLGLARLLESEGVPADGIVGHSVGEVAAAHIAGSLSLQNAVKLAFYRSQIQQQVAGQGSMLAVGTSESELRGWTALPEGVSVAAYNSNNSVALAGPLSGLKWMESVVRARNVFCRFMPVQVAYHSAQMDPLRSQFLELASWLRCTAPKVPLYSTTLGARVTGAVHDAEYWWKNARQPVLLQRALTSAIDDEFDAFLEVGPHPVLGAAIREVLSALGKTGVVHFCQKRKQDQGSTLRRSIAELYCAGVSMDWSTNHTSGKLVKLPRYPFGREHHWVESEESQSYRQGPSSSSSLLAAVQDSGPTPRFTADLTRPSLAYLRDHVIQGHSVFPASGYLDAQLGAAVRLHPECEALELSGVEFHRAFALRWDAAPFLMIDLATEGGSSNLYGRHLNEAWQLQARTRRVQTRSAEQKYLALGALQEDLPDSVEIKSFYRRLARLGLEYGPAFQRVESVRYREIDGNRYSVLAQIAACGLALDGHALHPALVDAALHSLLFMLPTGGDPVVPVAIEQVQWNRSAGPPVWVYAEVQRKPGGALVASMELADDTGLVTLAFEGLICERLGAHQQHDRSASWRHVETWRECEWPESTHTVERRWALVGNAAEFFEPLVAGLAERGIMASRVSVDAAEQLSEFERVIFANHSAADAVGLPCAEELLRLVQSLEGTTRLPLVVVTERAQAIADQVATRPAQATLWGLGRVVMTEHPELRLRLVDIDSFGAQPAARLIPLLGGETAEEELAVRAGRLLARRLTRLEANSEQEARQVLEPLRLASMKFDQELPKDHLEVRVEAVLMMHALSKRLGGQPFSDPSAEREGWALSGTVVRAARTAPELAVGDKVYALHTDALMSHVRLHTSRVTPLLPGQEISAATGYGSLYRAHYALRRAAAVSARDRVLITGVTSDAGLTCVQVARSAGARVWVMRAAPRYLSDIERMGAQCIDSAQRGDALLNEERPLQVDIVVNAKSTASDLPGSQFLRPGGFYLQLVPPDSTTLPVHALRGCRFEIVDLRALMEHRPDEFDVVACEVRDALATGRYELPTPHVVSTKEEITSADLPLEFEVVVRLSTTGDSSASLFHAGGSYLVTGGLTGFGLRTAQWLVENGARQVVLGSRRGVPDAEASRVVARLVKQGARVECIALDVTDPESIDRALALVEEKLEPLTGLFHSAMVLDDRPIREMTPESLRRVLYPKALGAWLLHQKTQDLAIQHFVLYSSVSGLVGNPKQGSYAAANAFLDSLAHHRHLQGLPALSVSFGALDDVGVVADDATLDAHLKGLGIDSLPADQALASLGELVGGAHSHVGVISMNWDKWTKSFPRTSWLRLSELLTAESSDGVLGELKAALHGLSDQERQDHVSELLQREVAKVLKLARVDAAQSFRTLGIDSLMAVEVQLAIEKTSGVTVPTIELLAGGTIAELSQRVLRQLEQDNTARDTPQLTGQAPSDLRSNFLQRIGVQPPYFDLFDFSWDGDWLEASAVPVPPNSYESSAVSAPEAARHLAIIGSCAVSAKNSVPGRVYYPVLRAEYPRAEDRSLAERPEEQESGIVRVRARCLSLDARASRARAHTELRDVRGNLLVTLFVDYHVIPQQQFHQLFDRAAQPTLEAEGMTPYAGWQSLPQIEREDDAFVATFAKVEQSWCLGHFPGFPAMPVSVIYRHAVSLIAEGVRFRLGDPDASIEVLAGHAETEHFVFAGDALSLRVSLEGRGSEFDELNWRCEVTANGRPAMSLLLSVATSQVHQSFIQRSLEPAALDEPLGSVRDAG